MPLKLNQPVNLMGPYELIAYSQHGEQQYAAAEAELRKR